MSPDEKKLIVLRQKINESLRIQRDSSEAVPYIDAVNISLRDEDVARRCFCIIQVGNLMMQFAPSI